MPRVMVNRGAATLLALLFVAGGPSFARASCGAESCVLDPRGPEGRAGRFSFDLAYQFIDQDQIKSGEPAEFAPEHLEIETRTQALVMTGRARVGSVLELSATLPWLDRFHHHQTVLFGADQKWDYSGLGDLVVLGSYTPGGAAPENGTSVSLTLGFKAPTGLRDVPVNASGQQPEPKARPGTGSWDGLGGVQIKRWFTTRTFGGERVMMPFSIGVMGRLNGKGTEDFQAGNEVQWHVTGGWALTPRVSFLAQVNSILSVKDAGEHGGHEGLDDHSGGRWIYATPGVQATYGRVSAFAYVQILAYEHVNGIQVVAPAHLLVGTTYGL